jgi:hypothetical protein
VHGLRAGRLRGGDDGVGGEVALDPDGLVGLADVAGARVGVGVDGDRPDAEVGEGPAHSDGDLAAVGDQHSGEHDHILKTP